MAVFKGLSEIQIQDLTEGHKPVADLPKNPIYDMMQQRDVSGYDIAKTAIALHEHRKTVKDGLDEDVLEDQKDLTLVHNSSPDRVTISVVDREANRDGTYNTHARMTMMRDSKGAWKVEQFFIPLDDMDDNTQDKGFIDLADGIREQYKNDDQMYVNTFLQELANGRSVQEAAIGGDYGGKYDKIYENGLNERKEEGNKPLKINPITAGRTKGSFEYDAGQRRGVSTTAPSTNTAMKM